ncbi:TPA: tRNA-specific adenosine deaminase [Candidatus Dependentiae bacterium]|nr:MAG: Guanine deaminase [candidate division TM6 bacterium GW2011_GWF2_36_131]KKQ03368.1 MAG: Guanine deaminase [candidate division TM6 bacterium GW2011_GWE2_36_25]KKQ18622.1 MAG: Guanine deaminase [candidate division TM6 bacterium GW2011_GWA2_36_9]HBR70854.1 tRNA-specific adenosine deaminase [Candidatus Dependentiae bacterium]HCU00543.1 tRNA-specific adenosine deaminase [Candidatus Dependentiae bacterium]
MNIHKKFLIEALILASDSIKSNGGPFGALVVKDDQIIATGTNEVVKTNDPTAHAEMVAIRRSCQELNTYQLNGCTLYSSCEPCPMCLSAVYWARIDVLFFALSREDAAAIGFDDAFIYKEIALRPEARSLKMEHVLIPQAKDVFELWQSKSDKVMY